MSGVTIPDVREQFEHNMRICDLVSNVNRTVARLRAALSASSGQKEIKSSVTNSTDQKPGRDVVERRELLRKELDERIRELDAILK